MVALWAIKEILPKSTKDKFSPSNTLINNIRKGKRKWSIIHNQVPLKLASRYFLKVWKFVATESEVMICKLVVIGWVYTLPQSLLKSHQIGSIKKPLQNKVHDQNEHGVLTGFWWYLGGAFWSYPKLQLSSYAFTCTFLIALTNTLRVVGSGFLMVYDTCYDNRETWSFGTLTFQGRYLAPSAIYKVLQLWVMCAKCD